jgi:hypothetical protein
VLLVSIGYDTASLSRSSAADDPLSSGIRDLDDNLLIPSLARRLEGIRLNGVLDTSFTDKDCFGRGDRTSLNHLVHVWNEPRNGIVQFHC